MFLESGHCHFIFEGGESGGHVGEYTSIMLWERAVCELNTAFEPARLEGLRLLAAGGIAGPRAAIVVATIFQRLIRSGAAVGLQMGTAYLATHEALHCKVVTDEYHALVRAGLSTTVVGRALGHGIRLIETPLSGEVRKVTDRYEAGELSRNDVTEALIETLRGKMRLAARGLVAEGDAVVQVNSRRQREEGAFMAGEVASLIGLPETIVELHESVTERARDLLDCEPSLSSFVSFEGLLPSPPERAPRAIIVRAFDRAGLLEGLDRLEMLAKSGTITADNPLDGLTAVARGEYCKGSCGIAVSIDGLDGLTSAFERARDTIRTAQGITVIPGLSFVCDFDPGKLAFLFPGQGVQYPGMFSQVTARAPVMRGALARLREWMSEAGDPDVLEAFWRDGAISAPWHLQPLLFSLEVALSDLLNSWGVCPDFVGGHSLGELAAIDCSGALGRRPLLDLVYARGRAIDDCGAKGSMMAIGTNLEETRRLLGLSGLPLAVVNDNCPQQVVVSGGDEPLDQFQGLLQSHSIRATRINVDYPFHSPALEPAASVFAAQVRKALSTAQLSEPPPRGLYSNVTARPYAVSCDSLNEAGLHCDASTLLELYSTLLGRHIASPVRFREMVRAMFDDGARCFVEVGPGTVLTGMVRTILRSHPIIAIPTLRKGAEERSLEDCRALLSLLGAEEAPPSVSVMQEAPPSVSLGDASDEVSPQEPSSPELRTEVDSVNVTSKSARFPRRLPGRKLPGPRDNDIAVVGVAIEVADAEDVEQFWENLFVRKEGVREVAPQKWDADFFHDSDVSALDRTYSRTGAAARFDVSDFMRFKIQPKAIEQIDRMQIVALKATERLMRSADWDVSSYPHRDTAVVVGYAFSEFLTGSFATRIYLESLKRTVARRLKTEGLEGSEIEVFVQSLMDAQDSAVPHFSSQSAVGPLSNMMSARIARCLDLDSPNCVVDSACASSLSSLDAAMAILSTKRSRYCIAGGFDDFSVGRQIGFSKLFALSRSGRCSPFGAAADGLVQGDGAALLLLTTVGQARRDGRKIRAVIRGLGGSSDGARSSGLTVPSGERQTLSARRCLDDAGWDPDHVDYIEAHGTGTPLGDPVEIKALARVFEGLEPGTIPVGSVKGNVGHAMIAAGAVSLVKVVCGLECGIVPPTVNVGEINPRLGLERSPFTIARSSVLLSRRAPAVPRRAMVCAYGFGGTNYHVAVEEWLEDTTSSEAERARVVCLAASTPESLIELLSEVKHAAGLGKIDLAPMLGEGGFRAALVYEDAAGLVGAAVDALQGLEDVPYLEVTGPTSVVSDLARGPEHLKIAFLFPGLGSLPVDAGISMYQHHPVFREAVDLRLALPTALMRTARHVFKETDRFIPVPGSSDHSPGSLTCHGLSLLTTQLAYLASVEDLGVCPSMVGGMSLGETAAAFASGAMSLEAATCFEHHCFCVFAEGCPEGSGRMLVVVMERSELESLIEEIGASVDIAGTYHERLHVVAGNEAGVQAIEVALSASESLCSPIVPSRAFHFSGNSGLSDMIERRTRVDCQTWIPPIPMYSSAGCFRYDQVDSDDAVRVHLSKVPFEPMDILGQLEMMCDDGANVFIEVACGSVYSNVISHLPSKRDRWTVPLDGGATSPGMDSWKAFLFAVGQLHCAGVDLDSRGLDVLSGPNNHVSIANLGGSEVNDERLAFLTEFIKANQAIAERAMEANLRAFNSVFEGGSQPDVTANLVSATVPLPAPQSVPARVANAQQATASSKSPAPVAANVPVRSASASVDVSADIRSRVTVIIKRHTGFGDSHLKDDVELSGSLGVDSVQQMLILDEVQKDFGIDLVKPLSEGRVPNTLGELLLLVDELQ